MQKTNTVSAFQNLLVWQKAMNLAKQVYVIGKLLPGEEKFGLVGQMQRCAVSIPSNIAEGAKRGKKEFVHFLRIASGSAAELETQLMLSKEIYDIDVEVVLNELTEVQKILESLIRKYTNPANC